MAKRKTVKKAKKARGGKSRVTTMNVSMPDSVRALVERRVERGGFGNASEYVRHLIREDHRELDSERRRLAQLILEGIESGPPVDMDEKFWEERRAELRRRLASRSRKAG